MRIAPPQALPSLASVVDSPVESTARGILKLSSKVETPFPRSSESIRHGPLLRSATRHARSDHVAVGRDTDNIDAF